MGVFFNVFFVYGNLMGLNVTNNRNQYLVGGLEHFSIYWE